MHMYTKRNETQDMDGVCSMHHHHISFDPVYNFSETVCISAYFDFTNHKGKEPDSPK